MISLATAGIIIPIVLVIKEGAAKLLLYIYLMYMACMHMLT